MSMPIGLLELGTNSLKLYVVRSAGTPEQAIQTTKLPWRVGHLFFSTGHLPHEGIEEVIAKLRQATIAAGGMPLSSMIAVATGVFREIREIRALSIALKEVLGLRLRVITGEDEARLMARGFASSGRPGSLLLCDLGGATTEWAWIRDHELKGFGSLPLGAIRNEYRVGHLKSVPGALVAESARICDEALRVLPAMPGAEVLATGGTARAVAALAKKDVVPLAELRALRDDTMREGPPAELKPERQAVFLSGVIILERLCANVGALALENAQTSVREGLAERLAMLVKTKQVEDLHATLLLQTRILPDSR